ncbi:7191_t:CDS:2 [Entrophospora sp. SA101]|nr:7191_t:CDS:2 [Entrophospora sp. SA101]
MLKKKSSEEKSETNIQQQVQEIIESTKKEFGEDSVSTLEESGSRDVNVLPTGSFFLDQATEKGGYIYGTIVEIFGQPGIGKTTLALHAVSECQKQGKIAAYIDLENKLGKNNEYAKNIGVNSKELIKFEARGGEEVFDFIDKKIKEGVSLFVIDSVAALVSKTHLEKGPESQGIASKARLISESLRIMLRPKERIQKGTEYIGIKTQANIVKNSFGSPGKKTDLEIIFSQGIQKEREIIDFATDSNIIQKSEIEQMVAQNFATPAASPDNA